MNMKLEALDKALRKAERDRDRCLRQFRLRCKHLRLAETDQQPPYRICIDCGAQERGWHCGYQVLCLPGETTRTLAIFKRVIVMPNANRFDLAVLRCQWPLYCVGQSHENFSDKWDYKSLTEIKRIK